MNIIITSPILNKPISTGLETTNERGNSIFNELGNQLANILRLFLGMRATEFRFE